MKDKPCAGCNRSCNSCPLKASDVKQGYKPSPAEIKALKPLKGHFVLSGDGVFHTVQGEGVDLGKPCTFVRLHFCNLSCAWCDTWYTWKRDTKEFWTESATIPIKMLTGRIANTQVDAGVRNFCHRVVFTGGEPLIQQAAIVEWMKLVPTKLSELSVEIETNGTILPDKYLLENARFNCSPKLLSSKNDPRLSKDALIAISKSKRPCFKFVCSTEADIKEVLEKYDFLPREQVYIMPEGVTKEENYESYKKIRDLIIKEGLNTTPRLQNIMFDGAQRGV
jgi:7-carboxy-7-deazaguanine synthase